MRLCFVSHVLIPAGSKPTSAHMLKHGMQMDLSLLRFTNNTMNSECTEPITPNVFRHKYVVECTNARFTVEDMIRALDDIFCTPPVHTYVAVTDKATPWLYLEFGPVVADAYIHGGAYKLCSEYTLHGGTTRTVAVMLKYGAAYYTGAKGSSYQMPMAMQMTLHVARSANVYACDACKSVHATPCFTCSKESRRTCRDTGMDTVILDGFAKLMISNLYYAGDHVFKKWEVAWYNELFDWAASKDLGLKTCKNHADWIQAAAVKLGLTKLKPIQTGSVSPYKRAENNINAANAIHRIAMDRFLRTSRRCIGCGHTVCAACVPKHVCTLEHTLPGNKFVKQHDVALVTTGDSYSTDQLCVLFPRLQFPHGVRHVPDDSEFSTKQGAHAASLTRLRAPGEYSVVRCGSVYAVTACGVARMLVFYEAFAGPEHHEELRRTVESMYKCNRVHAKSVSL